MNIIIDYLSYHEINNTFKMRHFLFLQFELNFLRNLIILYLRYLLLTRLISILVNERQIKRQIQHETFINILRYFYIFFIENLRDSVAYIKLFTKTNIINGIENCSSRKVSEK